MGTELIDLHAHILPGLDDGAPDLEPSVAMARMALAAGTRIMACTPHRLPGRYDTGADAIEAGIESLGAELRRLDIPLGLVCGSDVHVTPDLGAVLERDPAYRLNRTRYFLFEPPHQIAPPNIVALVRQVVRDGFVPVLTHPERLQWVHKRYDLACELNDAGCLMQVTAGALTGRFGVRPHSLAWRLVADGRVDIIASDGHNLEGRPPTMDEAYERLSQRIGPEEARAMVLTRPIAILRDEPLAPQAGRRLFDVGGEGQAEEARSAGTGLWRRLRGGET